MGRIDLPGWWASLGRPLARLPRAGAIAVLLALVLALAWSSKATSELARVDHQRIESRADDRIGDLELYRRIHARFQAGESYYAAALDEQRQHNYPTRPFVTVRLPTLAAINTVIGPAAWKGIALAVLLASIMAWAGALRGLAAMPERVLAGFLVFAAGVALIDARVLQFHEMMAGALVSLALGAYRQQCWWPALLIAAMALAIREMALPFLLLWGALAALDRRWKEAGAVAAVIGLFAVFMAVHAQAVEQYRLPGDIASPGWNGLNGPAIVLLALGRLTPLVFVPMAVAAPIALLPLLGWIALGGRLGLFATLWFVGYFLGMALFARANNFYWVLLVIPAYAVGLAFVPRALGELIRGAIWGRKSLS